MGTDWTPEARFSRGAGREKPAHQADTSRLDGGHYRCVMWPLDSYQPHTCYELQCFGDELCSRDWTLLLILKIVEPRPAGDRDLAFDTPPGS